MKIHDIAKLTGINPETIRSYRLKGLVHPKQKENGYYDYTLSNFIELAYLRKMRSYQLSLQDIHTIYSDTNTQDIIHLLDTEHEVLEKQIQHLQQQLRYINLEKQHILESEEIESQKVMILESVDEKIDYYDFFEKDIEYLIPSPEFYLTQTPVIFISKEILNGPIEDKEIPIRAGIGTYRFMLEEKNLPILDNAVIVPNGRCLSIMVSLTDLEHMNLMQIAPMMQYAKDHGITFLSDTTGYLARVQILNHQTVYHFRIRACIEIIPRQKNR